MKLRSILLLFTGIYVGVLFSWPGILIPNNWKCFIEIISKSKTQKVSLKALLAVSPNYFLKGKNNLTTKIRIVSDACFR